jgi:exonuclease III
MRSGTWNVRSLCRTGSVKTVEWELGKCKLDLVGVQEVRWDKGGTKRAEDYTPFYGERNEYRLGTGSFTHNRITSVVRKVEYVSDSVNIILRGQW